MSQSAVAFKETDNGRERITDGLWTHRGPLRLSAGSLSGDVLANGSVTTAKLAPGAAQAVLGSFSQAIDWTILSSGTWWETPVWLGSLVCSGALLRLDFNLAVVNPSKGATIYWSIMQDTVLVDPTHAHGVLMIPEANYFCPISGPLYWTPPAGVHRFGVALYSNIVGTKISNGVLSQLTVTEQRA